MENSGQSFAGIAPSPPRVIGITYSIFETPQTPVPPNPEEVDE